MQGSFVNQAQNDKTLTLTSGETLTVRRRLTAGERRAAFAVMLTGSETRPDGTRRVNPLMIGVGTIIAYLKRWTITDDAGQLVSYEDESTEDKIAILDDLEDSEFEEIRWLIDAHENAMLTERAEKKKNPEWRARILSDAAVAQHYRIDFAAVAHLDADVYDVLVEELTRQRTPPPPPEEEDDTPLWPARR